MRKSSIVLAAVGAGVLLIASPALAEDDSTGAQVSSYATPAPPAQSPVVQPTSGVLSAGPVPAAVTAAPLPVTGSDTDLIVQFGAAALVTGGGLLAVSRLRRRKTLPTAN